MNTFLFMLMLLMPASHLIAGEAKEAQYLRQGTAYLEAKDYQKAVKAFRQGVRLNPDSAEAHRGLGMAYLKLGSCEIATNPEMVGSAAAAFEEALRIAPDSVEARYQLGLAYLILYDKKSAIKQYEALRGLDAGVAEELKASISGYRAPKSFRTELNPAGVTGNLTPVVIVGNQVLVPVSLSHGDKTVQVTLLLDTGATCSLISREVAQRLGIDLERTERAKMQVVGGGSVEAWHTKLDRLTVGPQSKTDIDVAVVGQSGAGFTSDGLLGMNFLRNYRYSLDFTNKVINWAP